MELKVQIKNIPVVQPKFKCTLEANSLPNDQVTRDVGNLCFFKCLRCQKSNMSFRCLSSHYLNKHKENIQYKIQNVVEARYHKCHVCQKILLCDLEMIRSHVQHRHSLKRHEYFENYVLKKGDRVVHTFKEYLQNDYQILKTLKSCSTSAKNPKSLDTGLIMPSDLSSESEHSDFEA